MDANRVPLSPVSFLNRAAEVFPDKVGVVAGDGSEVTYAALRDRALRLADRLRHAGLRRGDRAAVLAPNDVPLLEAHYGVPAAGCALVALNTRLAPQEYAYILDHAGARVLIVDHSLADRIAPVRDRLTGLELVVEVAAEDGPAAGDVAYEEWLLGGEAGGGRLPLPDGEDEPVAVNYTSGTTGRPKGAVYTHRGTYLAALSQALGFGLAPASVYLWTLPMFHCNGWCFTWAVTAAGGRHVCLRRFEPRAALDAIGDHGVTHFCGAPVVLNAMAADESAGGRHFPQPVTAATGGAPPSPALISRMRDLGIGVLHLYGLTETYGPSLICEPQEAWAGLDDAETAAMMARQGMPTVAVDGVRVVDRGLADVPADAATMGEIVVRANSVMQGYFDDEEATREAFAGGWFHTGDLAVRHPDGYIEVRDRAKDIIISGGENVSSIEVENVLAAHPAVLEVAVVAAADERWGEVPVAFVTPRQGSEVSAGDLIAWTRERLAQFKAPKAVYFQELPKTSTGKIRKTELRTRVSSPWPRRGSGPT